MEICNSSGQTFDFLPPRKPGLCISRVDFFSLNIMNTQLSALAPLSAADVKGLRTISFLVKST